MPLLQNLPVKDKDNTQRTEGCVFCINAFV